MNVRELLRQADPLPEEPLTSREERQACRRAVLAAAIFDGRRGAGLRSRLMVAVVVGLILITAVVAAARVWSPLINNVEAAVRFEIRLAEDAPAPGLREAKVAGSSRTVYLHDEVVVSNGDVASAEVVSGSAPSQFYVKVTFTDAGAEKMRAATSEHIGHWLAVLIDGRVEMAPVIRSAITTSGLISGDFTKARAERIAKGIR